MREKEGDHQINKTTQIDEISGYYYEL